MKKIIIIILISIMIPFCSSISACTVFNATVDNFTIAGRNMDWNTQENSYLLLKI